MSSANKKSAAEIVGERMKSLNATSKMDVLRKTAQIISEQFGIDVIFRGNKAETDGKRIFVPSLPDHAPDGLVGALVGYIDHEVGHIRHTDFTIGDRKKADFDADKRLFPLTNKIEDMRQEKLMSSEYRGVGLNLASETEWTLRKTDDKFNDINPKTGRPLITGFNRLSYLMLVRSLEHAGYPFAGEFYEKNVGTLSQLVEHFDSRIADWPDLVSTDSCFDEAKSILKELDELTAGGESDEDGEESEEGGESQEKKEGAEQKPQDGGEGGEDEGSPGGDDTGQKDEDEKDDDTEDDGKTGEDSDGEDKEDRDDDDRGDGGDEGSESGDKEGDADDGADGDSEKGDKSSPGGEKDFSDETKEELKSLKSEKEDGEGGEEKNIHTDLIIEMEHASKGVSGYRAYTTEFDCVVPPQGKGSMEAFYKDLEKVRPYINTIYTVLLRVLKARTRASTAYGKETGRINVSSLGTMRAGNTRVFKKKRKGKKLDTYVEIIVDHSGSMRGHRIDLAQEVCIAIAEALHLVGVPFGICGFNAMEEPFGMDSAMQIRYQEYREGNCGGSDSDNFNRILPIVEIQYKRPEDSMNKARQWLPLMSYTCRSAGSANDDGSSIMNIIKRVMKRREKRKVLIILSDGQPAMSPIYKGRNTRSSRTDHESGHLKYVTELIERTPGIEAIGIGIQSDAVAHYYTNNVVVNSLDDLPRVVMTQLRDQLLKV